MKYTRNARAEDVLVRNWYTEMSDGREGQWPGVTTLIYCLTKAYYERTFLPQPPSRELTLIYAMGLWLEKVILGNNQNPTTGEKDGIYYHTDNLVLDVDGETKLGEVKSSNFSAKKDYSELNPAWHRQFMSYLYAEGITKGSFIVLHKRGDYHAGPFTNPDVRIWDVEYDQDELDENWLWMQGRKYILDEAIKDHVPPDEFSWRVVDWAESKEEKDDYECDGCSWFSLCDQRSKGLV